MEHICYMYGGSIYNNKGCIIEHPAILLDSSDGCVHGWGEADVVKAKLIRMAAAWNQAAFPEMAESLLMIDFSDASFKGIAKEEICYILRRAVEYTATSFQPALCKRIFEPNFREWLHAEMQRFPIDLMEQYYG